MTSWVAVTTCPCSGSSEPQLIFDTQAKPRCASIGAFPYLRGPDDPARTKSRSAWGEITPATRAIRRHGQQTPTTSALSGLPEDARSGPGAIGEAQASAHHRRGAECRHCRLFVAVACKLLHDRRQIHRFVAPMRRRGFDRAWQQVACVGLDHPAVGGDVFHQFAQMPAAALVAQPSGGADVPVLVQAQARAQPQRRSSSHHRRPARGA